MVSLFFKLKVYPVLVPSLDVWVLLMLRKMQSGVLHIADTMIALSFASAATMGESVSLPHSLFDTFTQ